MAGAVEVRLLGSVEVYDGGQPRPLSGAKQRVVLAVLALAAGRAVQVSRLVDAVWAESPPPTARRLVLNTLSELRRTLGSAVVTTPTGYLLDPTRIRLDLDVFEAACADARRATAQGEPERAAELLRAGLAVWRGPALGGIPALAGEAARLEERRLAALEERIDCDLRLGRHADLTGELAGLVAAHPLRERLSAQLMLALYRCGRRADALTAFREVRRAMVDALGLEPGAELQRLEQAILLGDPADADPTDSDPTDSEPADSEPADGQPADGEPAEGGRDGRAGIGLSSQPVPAQLPADAATFTGRVEHLRRLDALLPAPGGGRPTAVVITTIAGMPGVGKTALAVHWAHRVADRFPDGQLYVNMRGFDPTGSVLEPAEAVRGFLEGFGLPPERIPTSPAAQVGLYRSLLAHRRMLVLVDNARDAEQVRPLLPGAPGCVAVVTSRNQLSSLVVAESAHPVMVDLLSPAEAHQLLASRLGQDRVAAEPAAIEEITARCARLPLALAVVAARAATRPTLDLAALATELREARGGLDAFADEDPATDVRAVFSWSYDRLSADAARLFRLLGLHPGPDIGTRAAASLAGLALGPTRRLLTELTRAHLLVEHPPSRFAFHDLLRAYATELADTLETADGRQAAVRRMLDHYVHTADAAARQLTPHRDHVELAEVTAAVTPEDFADADGALAWLTAEQPVLLAVVRRAADTGTDAHAWQLAWSLVDFLNREGHWQDWVRVQTTALAAARRLADRVRQAHSHRSLGRAYAQLGPYDDAGRHFRQALAAFGELGDRVGQAHTHRGLGWMLGRQGRYDEALPHAQQALELFVAVGHRNGQANALNTIGWYHAHLGDHEQALDHCQRALDLQGELGNREGAADAWDSIGYVHHHLGNYDQAGTCFRQAIDSYRTTGNRYYEAGTLVRLGDTYLAAGQHPDRARDVWRHALTIFDQLGHPDADGVRAKLADLDRGQPGPGAVTAP